MQALASSKLMLQKLVAALGELSGTEKLADESSKHQLKISLEILGMLRGLQAILTEDHETGYQSWASLNAVDLYQKLEYHLEEHLRGMEQDAGEILELILSSSSSEIQVAYMSTLYRATVLHDSVESLLDCIDTGGTTHSNFMTSTDKTLSQWQQLLLPCQGKIETRMRCLVCQYVYTMHIEPFFILNVPLTPRSETLIGVKRVPERTSVLTLLETLQNRTAVEGVMCPKCSLKASIEKLKLDREKVSIPDVFQDASSLQFIGEKEQEQLQRCMYDLGIPWQRQDTVAMRWSKISKWPPTLILHISRSTWGLDGRHYKIVGHVHFPEILTIPEANMKYELVAVVTHLGLSSETGHYVTYRKLFHPCDSEYEMNKKLNWCKISDEQINYSVEFSDVTSAEASILVYEQKTVAS